MRIPRPVWLLGWSSLFTDAATEMIYPLLPTYLSRVLGAGALSLGIIEGIAEAVNSGLKIVSGYASDRWRRRKPIVIGGYALSSAARPLIALSSSWPQVLLIRVLDRTGKGIRGAPRDAILARLAPAGHRGRIFGFHRAMDHAGAIAGPLVAAAILLGAPGNYRLVFALTLIPGALAVALLFFVREPDVIAIPDSNAGGGNHDPSPGAFTTAPPVGVTAAIPRRLMAFFVVLLLFSLGNSADAFLLLRLSDELGTATYVPLFWSALHVVKASLSTWGGALSDRLGRRRTIIIGWAIYAVVYLGLATASSPLVLIAWFLTYGVYFALTEGAEKALVADLAPRTREGTAFGLYNATLGIGALAASIGFGFLYERYGAPTAFGTGAALAAASAALLMCVPAHDSMGVDADASNSRNQ